MPWPRHQARQQTSVHAPGKAPANGQRKIVATKYHHRLQPEENTFLHEQKLEKAGCFVMITNIAKEKMSASELLRTYKQQYGMEKNFSFLKEPLIANDTFLKKPSRIDALTFILLVSLMIWNLMQRELRNSEEVRTGQLNDLNKKPAKRPTSFLLMCQLSGVINLRHRNVCRITLRMALPQREMELVLRAAYIIGRQLTNLCHLTCGALLNNWCGWYVDWLPSGPSGAASPCGWSSAISSIRSGAGRLLSNGESSASRTERGLLNIVAGSLESTEPPSH